MIILLSSLLISCTLLPKQDYNDTDNSSGNNNGAQESPETPDDTETPDNTETPDKETHIYTDFSIDEKELLNTNIGFTLPFLPNNEYYLRAIDNDPQYAKGIIFLTVGNNDTEIEAYKAILSGYTYYGSKVDENGLTWHWYNNNSYCIDMTFYAEDDTNILEVRVYSRDYASEDRKPTQNNNGDCDVDFGDAL